MAGCVGGSREYKAGSVQRPLAVFSAPECRIETEAKEIADRTTFYLVQGRSNYALLVLNGASKGREIENYWLDDKGHNFATYTGEQGARVYTIPDKEGANGTLSYFKAKSYKTKSAGGVTRVLGDASETCELVYVPPSSSAATEAAPEPMPAPATANSVCVPGVTQECVGPAACKGGQQCREDGSGFSDCDCGTPVSPGVVEP